MLQSHYRKGDPMAKEGFDKEIQFLRMLLLTSGAYNRQQFADRLGISVPTFDKTMRRLKEAATAVTAASSDEEQQLAEMLYYDYYQSADPLALFLFRTKSMKESEGTRIALLLDAMHKEACTVKELLDICYNSLPVDQPAPDEKTIRSDIKYLEQAGVIHATEQSRPKRYQLTNQIITNLTIEQLTELFDFVDMMANTQIPSVHGYLLRDSLKKHLIRQYELAGDQFSDPFLYKYHYHSRILDEAHLFTLLQAIEARCKIRFQYFTPKNGQSYSSKNTNPLFEREQSGQHIVTLPLNIVFDHQYGRWYLLSTGREGIRKYRIEGITDLNLLEAVSEEQFNTQQKTLHERLQYSWLIDTGRTVTVRARFFHPKKTKENFIKERVLQQGQWGHIIEEDESSFIYEIKVNGIFEIKPWLRSFGSSCEVLEPLSLRNDLIAEWKELKSWYASI